MLYTHDENIFLSFGMHAWKRKGFAFCCGVLLMLHSLRDSCPVREWIIRERCCMWIASRSSESVCTYTEHQDP